MVWVTARAATIRQPCVAATGGAADSAGSRDSRGSTVLFTVGYPSDISAAATAAGRRRGGDQGQWAGE
ncbi:hypothetical protein Aple_013430 [Acrocarpospora pleiomorpha]|uniref:Uncharacterized protein n=1 Tax=Acrocarpospora pleiomorpha TaxID=90975 RepID=A0A5M3XK15_9ACTN|nr:hypothetical protein Aple_013430 [Acrocarpospora pleiomorpha]